MAKHNRLNYDLAEAVGREVLARRQAAGMTQSELADRSGFAAGSLVCLYEKGNGCPSLDSLCMMAIALGCDPGDLLPVGDDLRKVMRV